MAIEAQLADGRVLRFPDGTKPEVIDSVVKGLLAEGKPAPAPAPAPAQRTALAPTPEITQPLLSGEFDAGLPTTGTGATPAPTVVKEPGPAKRAPYKNRTEMLDDAVNLLEEGVDREEMKKSLQGMGVKWEDVVKHGQRRGSEYFKRQAPAPAPTRPVTSAPRKGTDEIKATPETEFLSSPLQYSAEAVGNMFKRVDASLADTATSYLLQSGAFDAEAAGRSLARNAKQRAAAAPSASIRAGMQAIGNAETYGEAIAALATNPRATFTLLAESVLTSLPGMVPSLVLGPAGVAARAGSAGLASGGMEYGAAMADVLQERRVNMLDPNAVAKALADPKIMAEIKDKGAKRGLIVGTFDALSMGLAGRFLKPAQTLIAEGKLVGPAAKKATLAAWGKELTTQMVGGAGGEFAAQKATGDDKPADVLLEALAEGATAPLEARANLREARLAEQQAAINRELAAPPPPERIEPTLDDTALVQSAETAAKEPSAIVAQKQRAERIAALTDVYQKQGIPPENAERIATRKVDAELKAEAKTAAIKIPEGRVEEITQELIAAGVPPQQAKIDAQALAQEEAQADELAQTEAGGTPDVARPISEPARTSAELAGQPDTELTTPGAVEPDTSGVVPAGQAAAGPTDREGAEPTALTDAAYIQSLDDQAALLSKALRVAEEADKVGKELLALPLSEQQDSPLRQKLDDLNAQHDALIAQFDELGAARTAARTTPAAETKTEDEGWKSLGQVQRYEEPGVGTATTDKPHGVYTTPADTESPFKDLGGERSTWDVNKDANVLDVTPLAGPDVAMRPSAVGAGAGVAAVKKLLGADVFARLKAMNKAELIEAAKGMFPSVDFSKYYDAQEVMEALGAQLAKQQGYDAIWQADKDPAFSEFVALTDNAMTPAAKTPEAPAPTVRELALQEQKAAGWNPEWPFVPADLANSDFRQLIADDPNLTPEVKQQIFESGYKLGVVPKNELPTAPETQGTTPDGTATTETVQTETQKQEAPAAGTVTKGKRGRPPAPKIHVVTENSEGKFDHVTNGEVVATYENKKQATAAVNLAKSKDKGDAALIAKNQAKLDAALASQGRGRPKKAATEDGTVEVSQSDKEELDALESALETYNSPAEQESILNAAMYINDVANDASLSKAVRERAQQMLDEDIDPKDVARSKKLRSTEPNVGKPDTGFNKAANGVQAITQIIKTGNAFQRFVAQRIRAFLVGVKFVVVEKGDPMPTELRGARGLFVFDPATNERTVYVRGASFGDQQGINNITVLHELLHAATANRITAGLMKGFKNAQLQKFVRDMQKLAERAQQAYEEGLVFGDLSPELQDLVEGTITIDEKTGAPTFEIFNSPYEFLAYGMSSPDFQKFLMGVKGDRTEPTGFAKFVANIRDLFGVGAKEATAFTDLVDITDKMLDVRAPKLGAVKTSLQQKGKFTPPEFDEKADIRAKRSATTLERDALKAKQKVAESREGDVAEAVKAMQNARDPSKVRDILARAWSGMSYLQREAAVRLPTFDFLSRWAAENGISSLRQTNLYLERMLGMSQQFLAGSEQIIGMLNRGFDEDPNLSRKQFENFVYATTIAEIDPSDPNAVERSKTLDADYKALGPVGQRMYKNLRDYYESIIELYSDLLDDQIQNAQGLSQEDKNNLMATLRKTFEAKARIRPYFPLVRRGDFWLAIGSGEQRRFYTFESRADRNAKAAELAAGRGDDLEDMLFRQEFVEGNDLGSLRMASKDSSQMLKQTFDAIDRMEMGDGALGSGSTKEALKDAVYQIYLNTMPEQTFRKQFTHRKNVTGFSTDVQQNIATTASKQAIQLSRLKYAPLLRNSLSAARDAIREREELSPFVQEAEKRVNMALSGQNGGFGEAVAGAANKASFFWFLSGASSALIQPSSVFISGLPVLAGNYNDTAGAAKELGKMTLLVNQYSLVRTNSDGTTSWAAPSIANNKSLPEDERRAISEMVSRGVAESTYASMVWGYQRTPTESTYFSKDKGWANVPVAWGKGKKLANFLVGALMHNTERLSREAVYLAAYRLGKKQGLSYEDAVQKAVESTNEALGNYDVTNKPRFMQQGIGKVAFQFKTYPLQMTLLLLTNFKRMLPFLNKQGKKEAATKFFGMMGSSLLLAGAANMALSSPILGLVGWAWSQMSAEEDWPEELKDISFRDWFFQVFLPEKLGDVTLGGVPVSDLIERGPLNAITGYDIASRIGLNDLWGRDSKETKTSRESAIAFILDNFGGPTASLLLGFADAWDAYALGDYQKMQEKLAPAAIRNLLVANKYADEGMKTGRGVELVNKDDVKTGELIGQFVGFRPDILAATQGPAFKLTGIEQKILNQRGLLLNKLDFQYRKDTDEGDERFYKILDEEVPKFNTKYPSYKLERDAIFESLRKKSEQRKTARAGVPVTEKNLPIVEEATDYLEDRLDRRAEEMAEKRKREKNPQ